MSKSHHQQETVTSYVIGFMLSLIFTVIPYYLVVHKTVAGNTLLATIIGFAVLQVFIQVFFFLHLGRGPKPLYNVAFFAGTAAAIVLVVGGSLFIMSHLHYNMDSAQTTKQLAESEGIAQVEGNKTGACQAIKANHQIILVHGAISPTQITAHLCDTLSFTNQDSVTRTIAFGTVDKPAPYVGQNGVIVRKGQSETITLNQVGNYSFYDNLSHNLTGTFTVTTQ